MKKLLSALLLLVSLSSFAQCLLRELPLQQRHAAATLVVEGRVLAAQSFWNENRTMIYTASTVEVLKRFKGRSTATTIEVITEGGRVGLDLITASSSYVLTAGDVGLFFCQDVRTARHLPPAQRSRPRYETYGAVQGFVRYNLQTGTASDPFKTYRAVESELYRVLSPRADYTVLKPFTLQKKSLPVQRSAGSTALNNVTITAGTGSVLQLAGTGFGATRGTNTISFANADDGGATFIQPLPTEYISWTDTQIEVEVPESAGSGPVLITLGGTTSNTGQTLTVPYAHTNALFDPGTGLRAYRSRHINQSGGGYVWQMNTGFDANAAAKASFLRAFNTWRCNTEVNWTIGATTTVSTNAADGVNVITFDNTSALPANVLGVCYTYFAGCGVGGTIYFYVNGLDIIFDEGSNLGAATWQYGPAAPAVNQFDFETVAVHELGHGHQLGHVISPGAIMHYALSNGTANRSLGVNDLAGGEAVQVRSVTAFPCAAAMTAYSGCTTLPIAVGSIKAVQQGAGVMVSWNNPAETEVQHYLVESSRNGWHFQPAATFPARQNNGAAASYAWMHTGPGKGQHFYRIKSVGYNGQTKYSAVAQVAIGSEVAGLQVYPNPVQGAQVQAGLQGLPDGDYSLQLFNGAGQVVRQQKVRYNGGLRWESVSVAGLPAGVYRLQLQGKDVLQQQTVVVE